MDIREIPRQLFREFGVECRQAEDGSQIAFTEGGLYLLLNESRVSFSAVETVVTLQVHWFEPVNASDRSYLDFEFDAGGESGSNAEGLKLKIRQSGLRFVGGQSAPAAKLLSAIVARIAQMLSSGAYEADGIEAWSS